MRKIISVVLSLMAVGAAATSCVAAEPQPFFYEARVLDEKGNPLQDDQSFRLLADVDHRNFTSDVAVVKLDTDGTARIPFLMKGTLPDLRTAAGAILTVQMLRTDSGQWAQVGFPQRLGAAAAALVADDVVMLTNEQAIVASSDMTVNNLTVTGTLSAQDVPPTSAANPKAIEFGDATGKMTVDAATVMLQDRVKRIEMMSGPFPATNSVSCDFRKYYYRVGNYSRVSFVYGDASLWNVKHGYIYCTFTAPCDCIYEIQIQGEVGKPDAQTAQAWNDAKCVQQGRVFLGLSSPDGQSWREPFDMSHACFGTSAFDPKDKPPKKIDVREERVLLQASRKWLEGVDPGVEWGSRDNVLHIPMVRGETFFTVFFIGPIGKDFGTKPPTLYTMTSDEPEFLPSEFVHGQPSGAAAGTWMKAFFKYYPLSAD